MFRGLLMQRAVICKRVLQDAAHNRGSGAVVGSGDRIQSRDQIVRKVKTDRRIHDANIREYFRIKSENTL
jgi:hypothetical protein